MRVKGKTMKIDTFIKGFDTAKDREVYVSGHLKTRYIDYEEKIVLCKSIIKNSMFKKVNGKDLFYIDSPMRWVFFTFSVITSYTDIDMPDDGVQRMRVFNEIEKHDVMTVISKVLGNEYLSLQSILNVMVEDEIRNNDLRAMLETKIEALSLVSSKIPWEKFIGESTN